MEKNYDWNGICIEENKKFYKKNFEVRNCIIENVCIDDSVKNINFNDTGTMGGIIGSDTDNKTGKNKLKLKTTTLENILEKNNAPKIIDYLSLDVEGAEFRVLKNFPFNKYKFLIMTIERPKKKFIKIIKKKKLYEN